MLTPKFCALKTKINHNLLNHCHNQNVVLLHVLTGIVSFHVYLSLPMLNDCVTSVNVTTPPNRILRTSFSGSMCFYPRPVLAFGYCRCLRLCVCVCVCLSVCLCVNHLLVRAITRDPFKLGSPNLDRRCKRPWLRSLLFLGAIDLDLQGQI